MSSQTAQRPLGNDSPQATSGLLTQLHEHFLNFVRTCAHPELSVFRPELQLSDFDATHFDSVPYPKQTVQPDANAEELISDAVAVFLRRNNLQGDRVALALDSNSSLARWNDLPPLQTDKIAEMARLEAQSQIPFVLDDVAWDFDVLEGSAMDGDIVLDPKICLCAIKKESLQAALKPLTDAGISIQLAQMGALATANYFRAALLEKEPGIDLNGLGVLEIGVDSSSLIVFANDQVRVKQIPLGGSHFTGALCRDMKLTYARGEALKLRATTCEDPKAVFTSLQPVYQDFATELSRAFGFLESQAKTKLRKLFLVGGGSKLPGLKKYFQTNLLTEFETGDELLQGFSGTSNPTFAEDYACFFPALGVALQESGVSLIRTNLLKESENEASAISEDDTSSATESTGVWGIVIGKSALRAVRVAPKSSRTTVTNVSFRELSQNLEIARQLDQRESVLEADELRTILNALQFLREIRRASENASLMLRVKQPAAMQALQEADRFGEQVKPLLKARLLLLSENLKKLASSEEE